MSISSDSHLLSQLSTSAYQLRILEQSLAPLLPTLDVFAPSTLYPQIKEQEIYKEAKVVEVTQKCILSFQTCIQKLPETTAAKACVPDILKTARKVLAKIEKKAQKLPEIEYKRLNTAIKECNQQIQKKEKSLSETPSSIQVGQPSPSQLDRTLEALIPRLASTALLFSGIDQEKGRIKEEITKYQKTLQKVSPGEAKAAKEANKKEASPGEPEAPTKQEPPVTGFARAVRDFTINYLDTNLVNVAKDPSERPFFLRFFFNDPFSSTPTPKPLHFLVAPLLKDHKDLVGDIIELNMLKGLEQGYRTLNSIKEKDPYFLVEFIRQSFHLAIQSVKKEEEARKEQGINPLTVKERNLLLSGDFKKNLTKVILDLALPGGAEDLVLPDIFTLNNLPDFNIPGIGNPKEVRIALLNRLKKEFILPLLQSGLEDLFQSIFQDLSFNDDVKTRLQIVAYSQMNPLISGESEKATISEHLQRVSMVSALSVGAVTAFFTIIIEAFKSFVIGEKKEGEAEGKKYLHETDLYDDIEKMLQWFAKGSPLRKFICDKVGLSERLGSKIISKLKEIKVTDFLDQQLGYITLALSSKKPPQAGNKHENKKELLRLRKQFAASLDGLASLMTDGIYAKVDEKQATKLRVFINSFLRNTLFHFIRFVFWVIRMGKHLSEIELRFSKAMEMLQQDEILMGASSEAARQVLLASSLPNEQEKF